jgi:hypothetical protein
MERERLPIPVNARPQPASEPRRHAPEQRLEQACDGRTARILPFEQGVWR